MGRRRRERLVSSWRESIIQAVAPSPEQQWDSMMTRAVDRANGIPDTRSIRQDLQEALLLLQRLKDQMVSTRDESIKVWRERAEKTEARVKELEAKYEVQPKPAVGEKP